ncbi:hypothetical protein BN1804_00263 [Proteus penneri]|uniref:Uncharacterized protein n=1 Tax=Proteus penneri TaxID=102862 RepID=A0A0G4Q0D5_9GAMM|nr:hypothetical protein BN1804_00263 [Proteus penneri]
MPWKSLIIVFCFIITLFLIVIFSFYLSIDPSCSNDKASLVKRCQRAISHYRY